MNTGVCIPVNTVRCYLCIAKSRLYWIFF